jgi:hypothetical protein
MALAKSNYLEGKVIEHVLRNVSYTSPATVYAALYTSDPGEANSGTEVAGGTYASQTIAFGAHSNGTVTNSGLVEFDDLPAATVTHVGLLDASTSGNLLYYGALGSSITVTAGSTISFPASNISVTET